MARTRNGYVAGLLAGAAIVAAATFGVTQAKAHEDAVAAVALEQTQASLESAAEAAASSAEAAASTDVGASGDPSAAPTTSAASTDVSGSGDPSAAPTTSAASSTSASSTSASPTSVSAAATGAPTTAAASTRKTATSPKSTPTTSTSTPTKAASTTYKDGSYSTVASYDSPGGTEQLGVHLTLKADKVVKSSLDLLGGAGVSHSFQSLFASGYLPLVLGKDIDSISVGVVSGSSLTGIGFTTALKQIEEQARAQT